MPYPLVGCWAVYMCSLRNSHVIPRLMQRVGWSVLGISKGWYELMRIVRKQVGVHLGPAYTRVHYISERKLGSQNWCIKIKYSWIINYRYIQEIFNFSVALLVFNLTVLWYIDILLFLFLTETGITKLLSSKYKRKYQMMLLNLGL